MRGPELLGGKPAPALPESVLALRVLVPALEQARRLGVPEQQVLAQPKSARLEPMLLQVRQPQAPKPRHQKQPWCTAQIRRQPE